MYITKRNICINIWKKYTCLFFKLTFKANCNFTYKKSLSNNCSRTRVQYLFFNPIKLNYLEDITCYTLDVFKVIQEASPQCNGNYSVFLNSLFFIRLYHSAKIISMSVFETTFSICNDAIIIRGYLQFCQQNIMMKQ